MPSVELQDYFERLISFLFLLFCSENNLTASKISELLTQSTLTVNWSPTEGPAFLTWNQTLICETERLSSFDKVKRRSSVRY